MSFTFNTGVPATANNPSVDQPDMLTNNVSADGILAVDHISFNTAGGGQHKQVTFNNKNAPVAQTDPQSVLYTGSGTASSMSQLLYRNQNGIFEISAIRAWGLATPAGISASQSVNIASVARTGGFPAGNFTVTMTANAVSSSSYAVLVSAWDSAANGALLISWAILSATQFIVKFRGLQSLPAQDFTDPLAFSFQVLQI